MKTIAPLLIYFLSLLHCQNTIAQQTLGLFTNSPQALEGYTLFSPHDSKTTYLIDNCGELTHSWESEYEPGLSDYLLENGVLLRAGRNPGQGGGSGVLEMIDWDGTVLWSHSVIETHGRQHHDIELLPNGNILLIVWDNRTQEEVDQTGSTTINNHLNSEQIVEIQPDLINGGATVVWEWKAWDHLIQDADAEKNNYGVVSEHPEKIDINFLNHNNPDWLHFNGIDYNEELDQIMISVRNFSEFWIIDHSTTSDEAISNNGGTYGMGGDLLYRWGNPQAYNQGNENDRKLFKQHNAHWIAEGLPDAGKILLFNNQAGTPENLNYSTVNSLILPSNSSGSYDYAGESYLPIDFDWTWQAPNPTDFYSNILSGVQRLENGNTLICEGTTGRFFEIDSNGTIVWEYINPVDDLGPNEQGQTLENNHVFRCTRLPLNDPAFSNQVLEPQGYIESGSTYTCDLNSAGCTDPIASNFSSNVDYDDGSCIYSEFQVLLLNEGWSMFSTYLLPENLNFDSIVEPIDSEIIIIKDNIGSAYLPEWEFNAIGDLIMGQGYQVKMNTDQNLLIEGESIIPSEYPINLLQGWNLIGYLKTEAEELTTSLNEILDEIIIVKDELGMAYLPEWDFNAIGELEPGKGYKLKMNSSQSFTYETLLGFCNPELIFSNDSTNAYCYETSNNVRRCYTNNIPPHSYGPFGGANTIFASQEFEYAMCQFPALGDNSTPLSFQGSQQGCSGGYIFGVSNEGINYSPYARLFWVNPLTQEENEEYEVEADFALNMDENGAHINSAQRYHYHNIPAEHFSNNPSINENSHSPIVGYAADGFPMYYKYLYINPLDNTSNIIEFSSSYDLKNGERSGDGITAPDGLYDGNYIQDYVYIESNSELDACGGRFAVTPEYPEGTYYYVLTDNWPYIPRCLNGAQVDNSFQIGPNCPSSNAEETCAQEELFGFDVVVLNSHKESLLSIKVSTKNQEGVNKVSIFGKNGEVLYQSNTFENEIRIKKKRSKYLFVQIEWNKEQYTKRIRL